MADPIPKTDKQKMNFVQKLRILHTEASSGWGGQEIRILTESKTFIEHGHQVFIAADIHSEIVVRGTQYGVPIYPINLKKKRLKDFFSLRSVIAKIKPDLVSCHSSTDHWLTTLSRLTLKHKFAIVRTRHISAPVTRNKTTRWLYNKGTDAIMTTGEYIREQLLADRFVGKDTVFSVPTGINQDEFYPTNKSEKKAALNLPTDHFIFGIVATLRSWKGHTFLLEAFEQLNDDNCSLVIVGDGPQMDNYSNLIAQSTRSKSIYLVGNKTNVADYLQAFDGFVFPSYANEGVPQALLQAMATGLPIITCPIGGIPESVKDYSKKTLVEPKNAGQLAAAMENLLSSTKPNDSCQNGFLPFTKQKMYDLSLAVYQLALRKD